MRSSKRWKSMPSFSQLLLDDMDVPARLHVLQHRRARYSAPPSAWSGRRSTPACRSRTRRPRMVGVDLREHCFRRTNITAPSEVSPAMMYFLAMSSTCLRMSDLNCFCANARSTWSPRGRTCGGSSPGETSSPPSPNPVGGGRRSAQSTRMPLESVVLPARTAAGGSTFLTRASSCTSPKAPRERLSPSSSCRLTTLPVRLSIFFLRLVDGRQGAA